VRVAEGHHLRHWAAGGPTTLSNLALLCRWHHRVVHEGGYSIDPRLDGTLKFLRPDGREVCEAPSIAALPDDPIAALRATPAANGLTINARTAETDWDGRPLDIGWAIDVLHPVANPAPPAAPMLG
jgi:hypothetical protein